MKNWILIILLGCSVSVTAISFSQAEICDAEFIYDCFYPEKYSMAAIYETPDTACKEWEKILFNYSGTYYIAVYPPAGKTPYKVHFYSHNENDVGYIVQTGEQIESILRTFSEAQLKELSVNEIREGKIPVIVKVTFHKIFSGSIYMDVYCDPIGKDDVCVPGGGCNNVITPTALVPMLYPLLNKQTSPY